MRIVYKNIHLGAIALFYATALVLRLTTLVLSSKYLALKENYLFQLSTGIGPAIGAIVAMAIFKRKTEYTFLGKSIWKSMVTIAVPCLVFSVLGGWNMGGLCLLAFILCMDCWKNMVGGDSYNMNSGNYLCGSTFLSSRSCGACGIWIWISVTYSSSSCCYFLPHGE